MSKRDVNKILADFGLEHHKNAFRTAREFRELKAADYLAHGVSSAEEVLRLRDAVNRFNELHSPKLSPSSSIVLDNDAILNGAAEEEDAASPRLRGQHYTTRGTTVLTRTNDNHELKQKSRIVVAIRKRPLSRIEESNGFEDVMESDNLNEIVLREPKVKVDLRKYTHVHRFYFDEVFDESSSNEAVYQRTARALIDTVFEGGSATCFAYGQTGSGKTHTMLGKDDEPGLYALAAKEMFDRIDPTAEETLSVAFYEIYSGKLYDLLNGRRVLKCLEDDKRNANIRGLTEHKSSNVRDVMQIIERGSKIRSSGCTGANDTSSRSHAILEIRLRRGASASAETAPYGKFTFIDLAGSERGADTLDCARQTRMEGAEINKSLLALKECIRFLDMNRRYVPFRGSKLTEVLRDSFIGNCRTVMIGAVSPSNGNCEHTLNTLRYADRVKELKKSPATRRTLGENELTEMVFERCESGRPSLAAGVAATPPPGSSPRPTVGRSTTSYGALQPSARTNLPPTVPKQQQAASARASLCFDDDVPARQGAAAESDVAHARGQKRPREEQENEAAPAERAVAATPAVPAGEGSARPGVWDALIADQRQRALAQLSQYLDADMSYIKDEYQLKYDVQQGSSTNREFVMRARSLLELKRNAIHSFAEQVDQLDKLIQHCERAS